MAKLRKCMVKSCHYEAKSTKRKCEWHWLIAQPPNIQRDAALVRLAKWDMALPGTTEGRRMRVPKEQWPDGERWCSGCQSFIPLFYCSGSRCKSCNSSASRAKSIEEKYGITEERYQELFKQQNGRCAVCRNKPRSMWLAVDHDHKTGEVRGLLCKRCNHDLLGGGHDDVEVLWRAVTYLLYPPANYPVAPDTQQALVDLERRLRLKALIREPNTSDDPPPF